MAPRAPEPFTRQLRGKLRELRFHLGRQQTRITYSIAGGRRIVLLTVFVKTRQRERPEVQRPWSAMQTCIAEGHTAEDGK
ncbi:MAG TPA: type II toxin-antitoxin system RelE/ParE family toxin [Acidimicrobiales bacterium]|nr:type II toxin-antitoxin system RelE/ParE family toxin [Acidimicrobiales bacterium]